MHTHDYPALQGNRCALGGSWVDVFGNLMVHCIDLLEVQAVAITVADESEGGLSAVIASSATADRVAMYEVEHDNGPAGDCYRTGATMAFLDLRAVGGGWPDFSRVAMAAGFGECSCLPMRLDDYVVGVLQLFGALDNVGVRIAGALSEVATVALLSQVKGSEPEPRPLPVQAALRGRLLIEQAKGMISERLRISTDDALRVLRQHARRDGRRLTAVATDVVRDAGKRKLNGIADLITKENRIDLGRC